MFVCVCVSSFCRRERWCWTAEHSANGSLSYKWCCTCASLARWWNWPQCKDLIIILPVRPELMLRGELGDGYGASCTWWMARGRQLKVDRWMNERGVYRLRYIDETDGPLTVSHGGPQRLHSQHSKGLRTHTSSRTYAQRTQVDCLLDLYLRGELIFIVRIRPEYNPVNFSTC